MKPLKAELDALAAVLMAGPQEHITEKEEQTLSQDKLEALAYKRMFTKAIEALDEARGGRTYYMVVLRHGEGTRTFYSGFGPYSTKPQAETAVSKLISTMDSTAYAVVPTRSEGGLANLLRELDSVAGTRGDYAIVADDARAFRKGWKGQNANRNQYVK